MERRFTSKVSRRLTEWFDTLCVGIEIGLSSDHDSSHDSRNLQPAITAVEELQRLGANTCFVPSFPLEFVAIEHPGRITANGLGTLEIGHSADRFVELPGVTGTGTAP